MKKTLLLTALMVFVICGVFAQNSVEKAEVKTLKGTKTMNSVITCQNASYVAGATFDLNFNYIHNSPDTEYTDGISLDFPEGVTVNMSADFALAWNEETGNGVVTSWGDLGGGSQWGDLSANASFVVNVTVDPGFTGNLDIVWLIVGDGYGSDPHTATGTLTLTEALAVDLSVISVSPSHLFSAETFYPAVVVENLGSTTADDFSISVVINDGTTDVYSSTLAVTGAGFVSFANETYIMDDLWSPEDGNYVITATVTITGDLNTDNNEIVQDCEVAPISFGSVISYFPANAAGCPGVETDGINIYTSYWGSGNFDRYDMNGLYIETFTVAGATAIRDMAYDGQYFYGSNASTSLFQMDLANETLISTIAAPVAVRAIAYDDDDETFWANNWDTNLTEFTVAGTATGNNFASPSIYGAAYDNWSDPLNPTIWVFEGTGDSDVTQLTEYALNGTATGRIIDVSAFPEFDAGVGSGSGGLASYEEDGAAFLLVNVQQDPNMIYKVFLAQAIPVLGPHAITLSPLNNANNVAVDAVVSATFDVNITEVDFSGISITPDPGNVVVTIEDAVLTLAHDDLDFNTVYTVLIPTGSISDGVDDLAYDVTWSFTTMLDPDACNDPSNIIISEIGIHGATVSWTENGAGTEWTVVYGPTGFDPATEGDQVAADVTNAVLTELDADTEYEVYVQAICGAETSGWAGPVTFTTLFDCGPAISSLPYTNAFDVADPCWLIAQTNPNETWEHNGVDAYSCEYDAAVLAQNEWLVSPVFDLSAFSTDNIVAKFNWSGSYYWSVDPEDNYDMLFKASSDGTNWTTIWDETVPGVFESWTEYLAIVNVSAYAGESSVWFAFNYVGTDGAQWLVNDFALEIATSAEIANSNVISIYPNPSNGFVNINVTENSIVSVVDIAGRIVESFNVNANQEVKFSQSAGLYIVKVESNGKVSTHKLIIQ
ncbi:MAG TPA: T9SS type A sorting domain-containing protein [Bacteroidales bacterium]|nr:T9SS type A sorting domain-containing protein [Bacteroidales bacterium]